MKTCSLPQAPLLQSVKECIGNQEDEHEFTSRSGVSVEGFLEVLRCYLEATLVTWKGKVFAQKSGVCIGSCVAPILSTIFLAKVDRAIQGSLFDLAIKVFRYVDDYLVFVDRCVFIRKMINVMKVFREQGHGLTFTCEVPRNDALQYLDLQLAFSPDSICWRYKPRSQKGLLDYQSGHSRLVKNGIASSCIRSAISKSCPHLIRQSMCEQAVKLRQAGALCCLRRTTLPCDSSKVAHLGKKKVEELKPVAPAELCMTPSARRLSLFEAALGAAITRCTCIPVAYYLGKGGGGSTPRATPPSHPPCCGRVPQPEQGTQTWVPTWSDRLAVRFAGRLGLSWVGLEGAGANNRRRKSLIKIPDAVREYWSRRSSLVGIFLSGNTWSPLSLFAGRLFVRLVFCLFVFHCCPAVGGSLHLGRCSLFIYTWSQSSYICRTHPQPHAFGSVFVTFSPTVLAKIVEKEQFFSFRSRR
ncbi:hypothetical protein HPB51_021737 [Rhipicephalus microplus]|uniref:Reverse transcriptase domain-containing protein n=1 Tax=Rhipicephalus microplus TaxID=6941 RepID=A0A9J6DPY1_RHIMP|nr:hypothetical protein HPB51_021737 [Rhipicephalus microplus]